MRNLALINSGRSPQTILVVGAHADEIEIGRGLRSADLGENSKLAGSVVAGLPHYELTGLASSGGGPQSDALGFQAAKRR